MAKAATKAATETEDLTSAVKQEVAIIDERTGLPAELMDQIRKDAGGGLSKDAADNMVPLIYLLQSGSPQVKPGDPAKIEGAEQGDIWLRGAEKQIVKGSKGIVFQPCHFYKEIVEWMPERGGFVARYPHDLMEIKDGKTTWKGELADVKEVSNPQDPSRKVFVRANGNNVVETRCHAGYVHEEGFLPMPFIINLSSTGHTFSRSWMMQMNSTPMPNGEMTDKSWVWMWRLKTTLKKNAKGSWYMYTSQKERFIKDAAEYNLGKQLLEAMLAGTLKAEAPIESEVSGDFSNEENEEM